MKEAIHPTWYPEARIVCASCGTEWTMGSTVANLRVDICSNCHPFYTGEQRIVDTEGQVDRFMKRLQVRDLRQAEQVAREEAKVNADVPLEELELGTRYVNILNEAGIALVSDLIAKLENEGDDAILGLPGIGVKVLADAKRRISELGYQLKK
ncbi:MAG TPA: 50S ribosomal protein L31 [Aggregatilineales bacterium]|nr:50S ribosomal protein L31 [Aggregatilineales bacterium]